MSPRTIFCLLVLAVLGLNAPSHAKPQPKSNELRKGEIQKTYMESAEVKWRVVGLRRKSTIPCPQVNDWQADDWLDQTLRGPQKEYRLGDPKRPQVDLSQLVAAAPLLHDL